MARLYRIIYVTGMKPKPPPAEHRAALLRVFTAALGRARPAAGEWLAAHPEQFTLISWTHLLYSASRDIAPDLPGIERLLRSPVADPSERRDIDSLRRHFLRWRRIVGDMYVAQEESQGRHAEALRVIEITPERFVTHDFRPDAGLAGRLPSEGAQPEECAHR